jgi:hypothetical protein
MKRIDLQTPITAGDRPSLEFLEWAAALRDPLTFAAAGLPAASDYPAGTMAYIPDESGGAVMAFFDGTDWRRCTDRAVVS